MDGVVDSAGAAARGTAKPPAPDDHPAPGHSSGDDGLAVAPQAVAAIDPQTSPPPRPRLTDEWQRPPWNRWAFQHVSELVPTARVSRGTLPVWELAPQPIHLDALPVETTVSGETLGALLRRSETDGVIVLSGGDVVMERYFNGMRRETRHLLQSVSKSFTGTLAGALQGRGWLDDKAPVSEYLPELRGTSFDGALVRHLLDMSAGTRFSEDYDDPGSDVNTYQSAAGWRPADGGPPDLLAYIHGLENHRAHGELFEYRSILTDLLALVVERAGRRSFADLLGGLLWSRMGMEQDAEITVDQAGNPMADGGISATLRDLARFGQLIAQGGCVEGRQLVPVEWIADTRYGDEECRRAFLASEEATKLAICEPWATECYPKGHYRNQWWVPYPDEGVLLASGVFGQMLYVHLTAGVVIAKVSSQARPFDADLSADVLRGCAAVAAALAR